MQREMETTHIGRIHGRSSISRTCNNQDDSCHSNQPGLQNIALRTLEHNYKNSEGNKESQHPLSNGSGMQVNLQRRTPKHVLVLWWHVLHDGQCTAHGTRCLSKHELYGYIQHPHSTARELLLVLFFRKGVIPNQCTQMNNHFQIKALLLFFLMITNPFFTKGSF